MGTLSVVEACRDYIEQSGTSEFRFLHVSTDEVFGDLGVQDPPFSENSRYHPNSPYSASKAASDFIIKSWHRTYGFPGIVTNCSNNFGPGQNAKAHSKIIGSLMQEEKFQFMAMDKTFAIGFLFDTHVAYLIAIMRGGTLGQSYLIGGDFELTNLDLVGRINSIFNQRHPQKARSFEDVIEFVPDRKGHDRRYAIDTSYLKSQFPSIIYTDFDKALCETMEFYFEDHL